MGRKFEDADHDSDARVSERVSASNCTRKLVKTLEVFTSSRVIKFIIISCAKEIETNWCRDSQKEFMKKIQSPLILQQLLITKFPFVFYCQISNVLAFFKLPS